MKNLLKVMMNNENKYKPRKENSRDINERNGRILILGIQFSRSSVSDGDIEKIEQSVLKSAKY